MNGGFPLFNTWTRSTKISLRLLALIVASSWLESRGSELGSVFETREGVEEAKVCWLLLADLVKNAVFGLGLDWVLSLLKSVLDEMTVSLFSSLNRLFNSG